jgi:gas vesicle protein
MAKNKSGILLFIGAILGAITALFFSTTEEGETKEIVRKKVKESKEKLSEVRESEMVKKIFGKNSTEVMRIFRETKDDLVNRLAKVKGSFDKIDKKKYMDAVNEVVSDLKKNKQVTSEQLSKMKKYLTDDYKKLSGKKIVKKA